MKTILNILFIIIITLISCAKPEEIVLEKDYNSSNSNRNFFPVQDNVYYFLDSQNGQDDYGVNINNYGDYSSFEPIGGFVTDRSYVYGDLGGNYDSYQEFISVKKDDDNITFLIEERHEDVYPSYSSSYWYTVEKTPYELELLKPNLVLNQTWTTSQNVTSSHDGYYSYFPQWYNESVNVEFNYTVTEVNGERYINNILYFNLVTVSVEYGFGQGGSYTRSYTFSDGAGLVEFHLEGYTYLRES